MKLSVAEIIIPPLYSLGLLCCLLCLTVKSDCQCSGAAHTSTHSPLKNGYNTVATTLSRTAAVSIFCSYPALGMDGLDGGAKWCGLA